MTDTQAENQKCKNVFLMIFNALVANFDKVKNLYQDNKDINATMKHYGI
jgi:hypothetical protein